MAPSRPVAIKVLTAPPGVDGLERFKREVQALVQTGGHPGVVRIIAGGLEARPPFYVMELVDGESLAAVLERGPLEPRRAAEIVRDVADAIAFAHAHGILHRDLKPANILVETGAAGDPSSAAAKTAPGTVGRPVPLGRGRVCDFGIARLESAARLTRTGVFVGSPAWAAPEQLAGRAAEVDVRTDVHGLGAILFHAIAGVGPYEHQLTQSGHRVLGPALPLRDEATTAPAELAAIVDRSLALDPAQRYDTAAAFRDDLDRWLRGETPLACASWRDLGTRGRRLAWTLARLSLVALLLTVAVVASLKVSQRRRTAGHLAAVLRPDASLEEARAAFGALERDDAAAADLATARDHLHHRELEARLAAFSSARETPPLAALEAARDAALVLPATANLAGERDGRALGDALLDARAALLATPELVAASSSRAASLLDGAVQLAAARLATAPDDPAGRLVRAKAALARLGAPWRPLGAGELGIPGALTASVAADLEVAAKDPGRVGAEADWLLVDLELAAVPASAPRLEPSKTTPGLRDPAANAPSSREALDVAGQALTRAASRHPGSPARPVLERALGAPLDPATYLELSKALGDPATASAAGATLSRLAARAGSPSLFEHAELVGDGPALAATLAVARGDEPPPSPSANVPGDPSLAARLAVDSIIQRVRHGYATYDEVRPRLERDGALALERFPAEPVLLTAAGLWARRRASICGFWFLAEHSDPTSSLPELLENFDRSYRRGAPDVAAARELFEIEGDGPTEFVRRIARDLDEDPLMLVERRTRPEAVAAALTACAGARRIEELEDPPEDPQARAALALEALRSLDTAAAFTPGVGLFFRARARLAAIPAPLGPALARLDLARFERFWRAAMARDDVSGEARREAASALFQGASLALRVPGGAPLEGRLFALGVRTLHEAAVGRARDSRDPSRLDATFRDEFAMFDLDPRFRGLLQVDPKRRALLEANGDDRARVAEPETAPVGESALARDGVKIERLEVHPLPGDPFTLHVECDAVNAGESTWSSLFRFAPHVSFVEPSEHHYPNLDELALLPLDGMFVGVGERVAPGERHTFRYDLELPRVPERFDVVLGFEHYGVGFFGPHSRSTFDPAARR